MRRRAVFVVAVGTKMRQSLAPFSESGASCRMPWLVDCITDTPGSRFSARVMPEAPLPSSPRGRLREPRHRLLADRPIDQRGEYAEADRDPPDQVIVALDVVEPPSAPAAEEAAELMTEEHDAPEHRHVGEIGRAHV